MNYKKDKIYNGVLRGEKHNPAVQLAAKLGWDSISIDGARDMHEHFFPKYPDSEQPRYYERLQLIIKVLPRDELEKFCMDALCWMADLDIRLSHIYGELSDRISDGKGIERENKLLKYFVGEFIIGTDEMIKREKEGKMIK